MKAMKYAAQTHTGRRRNAAAAGFTLLELLIVIALTAIIIVLVFRPLIDSFNLTSRAGTQIESQTAAREVLREVSDTLGEAELIYDNTRPNAVINIWLQDNGGNPIVSQLPFGLVDYVAPGHQADQTTNPTGPTDPTTGEPILDPTAPAGKKAVSLPVAPGRVIERLFLALRDNTSGADKHNAGAAGDPTGKPQSGMPVNAVGQYHGYANRWADPQQPGSPGNDNRYTLYKAQFLAYIPNPDNKSTYIPNLSLFHTGTNPFDPTSKTDKITDPIIQNDPNFFYDDQMAGDAGSKGDQKWAVPGWKDLVGDGHVYYWENWRAVATSMLELNKADTIGLDRDAKGNIVYDGNGRPTPRALITFAPTYIENEAGNPVAMSATGSEVSYVASPAFILQHGAWTTPFRVLVYQNNVSPLTNPITINPGADPVAQNTTFYEYIINPLTNATQIVYHDNGAVSGDIGPMISPTNNTFTNLNPQYAFTVDYQRGIVNFAFPQWEFTQKDANGQPIRQQYNAIDINSGMDGVNPVYVRRYLCLDDQGNNVPPDQMPAGSVSPLAALFLSPTLNDATTTPQRVHIVPGTEVVYGPDQRWGPHYGWSIQYTRVSSEAGAVGPNQYKILYDATPNAIARAAAGDQNDPRVRCGYIEFDSTPDPSATANLQPNTDPRKTADVESPTAGIYRTHSLPTLKTQNGADVQADPVLVQYNFQMNRSSDVVKVDYLTRELMTVAINSRLYDPASASPQDTVLTSQVKVRNLQR
jgi:prepilin-type N-terminal cleavage/methylation domain-containing protein